MIDISTYRTRIGLFGPGRGFSARPSKHDNYNYNPCNNMFIALIEVLFIGLLSARLLILANDVESNPGPLTDKEEILAAIRANGEEIKSELRNEIDRVVQDVSKLRTEVKEVKEMCGGLRADVNRVERTVNRHEVKISENEGWIETQQLDIDALNLKQEKQQEIYEEQYKVISDALDNLERKTKNATFRIFGLQEPEDQMENKTNLTENVIENVCKIACPYDYWDRHSVEDCYRVPSGANFSDTPGMVIVKFKNSADKHKIFTGRDKLRKIEIRVSDELTTRQRTTLKQLKDRGQSGYFQKGKLHIRDENSIPKTRVFKNAKRRVTMTNKDNSDINEASGIEEENENSDDIQETIDIDE